MWRNRLSQFVAVAALTLLVSGGLVAQTQIGNFLRINLGTTHTVISTGTGSPTSVVTGSIGDLFLRTDGGATSTLYVKESGSATKTGWTAHGTTLSFTEYWPANVVDGGSPYSVGWNTHTAATDAPTDITNGSVVSLYGTMRFDDSATESINRQFPLPSDWTGALDLTIYWQTTATSGNVVWQVATVCIADNENMDPSTFTYNTAQTVTDAAKGSATFLNTASISSLTTTGCAAGELLVLKLFRNPAHASDTLANNADFVGARFTYRRAL